MKTTFILLFSLLILNTNQGQDSLIAKIEELNILQFEAVGYAGVMSDQYKRYLKLSKKSTIEELLALLDASSPVVQAYVSWALIDKQYNQLDQVFERFLNDGKNLTTQYGCTIDNSQLSHVFYYRYWSNLPHKQKEADPTLIKLDSIILYQERSNFYHYSLKNRVYDESYHPQIEKLAFKKSNTDALCYLSNWYKAKYKEQLSKTWTQYFKTTNFTKRGIYYYYLSLSELLKFKTPEIESLIKKKLKKDKAWRRQEKKFIYLLNDNSIYLEHDF